LKYGVIICSKCGKAKGVETRRKTTSCQCGREIRLKHGMFKFMTDSPSELADTVASVNAALHGAEPMPKEKKRRRKDSYAAMVEGTAVVKDPLERLHAIAAELTKSKSQFELDDLKRVLNLLGRGDPERILAGLLENGIIYESSPGKYKAT
jgi:hypothetical protein